MKDMKTMCVYVFNIGAVHFIFSICVMCKWYMNLRVGYKLLEWHVGHDHGMPMKPF